MSLGKLLMAGGQPRAAAEHFRLVLKKLPWEPKLHFALGYAAQECRTSSTRRSPTYQKAVELDPRFTLAHYNLGIVFHNVGRIDEAIAEFRKAPRD